MKHLAAIPLLFALLLAGLFASSTAAQTSTFPPIPTRPTTMATGTPVANPQTMTTTWRSEEGLEHTVTTFIPEESDEDEMRRRLQRHTRMVNLLREIYPPVTFAPSVPVRELVPLPSLASRVSLAFAA